MKDYASLNYKLKNHEYEKTRAMMKKLILLFTFLTTVLFGQEQITNQNLFDAKPFIPEHYAKRVAKFEQEPVVTGGIIFLGNSITEGGDWAKLIGDSAAVNRGISGDITFGVLKRLDDVIRRKPEKLFILIGINDIAKDIPDAVIADNCRQIIKRVKAGSPKSQIFLQSLMPVNPFTPKFPQHFNKNNHVVHTNQMLLKVARKTGCHFINLFPIFMDAQQLMRADLTYDGLHLNEKGYKIWVTYLKQMGYL